MKSSTTERCIRSDRQEVELVVWIYRNKKRVLAAERNRGVAVSSVSQGSVITDHLRSHSDRHFPRKHFTVHKFLFSIKLIVSVIPSKLNNGKQCLVSKNRILLKTCCSHKYTEEQLYGIIQGTNNNKNW